MNCWLRRPLPANIVGASKGEHQAMIIEAIEESLRA